MDTEMMRVCLEISWDFEELFLEICKWMIEWNISEMQQPNLVRVMEMWYVHYLSRVLWMIAKDHVFANEII